MGKSKQRGTPVRTLRISNKCWAKWEHAARVSGVSRNQFIVTVVNHAAYQVLREIEESKNGEPIEASDYDDDPADKVKPRAGNTGRDPDVEARAVDRFLKENGIKEETLGYDNPEF